MEHKTIHLQREATKERLKMVEWIKRKIKSEKITIPEEYNQYQISLNSWGHLTIRLFKEDNPDEDIVIVFDSLMTRSILRYIGRLIRGLREYDC